MTGATKDFEVRACTLHRVVLSGSGLCRERFTDQFGNSAFCGQADDVVLVEKYRLDEAERRAASLEKLLAEARAESSKLAQLVRNLDTWIGIDPVSDTECRLKRAIAEAGCGQNDGRT